MYSSYSGGWLPSHVMWCNFISLSKHFFFFFFPLLKAGMSWMLGTRWMFRFLNICFIFISHWITSIMHHKHVIGSSWGKFPPFGGNCAVLSGERGKSFTCAFYSALPPPLLMALLLVFQTSKVKPTWQVTCKNFFVWETSPRLLYICKFWGQTLLHSFHKEPSVDPSNFPGLHHGLWII